MSIHSDAGKILQKLYRLVVHRQRVVCPRELPPVLLDPLEARRLLSGSVFTTFLGEAASGAPGQTALVVDAEGFDLDGSAVTLGLNASADAGSALDPGAVTVRDAAGAVVSPRFDLSDVGGTTDTRVVITLAPGAYTVEVEAENGTAGAYRLDASLVGDIDGDRDVDLVDLTAVRGAQRGG